MIDISGTADRYDRWRHETRFYGGTKCRMCAELYGGARSGVHRWVLETDNPFPNGLSTPMTRPPRRILQQMPADDAADTGEKLPLGDMLQRLAGERPNDLKTIEVWVRDIWHRRTSTRAPQMLEGDIVVTQVSHHYSLGRVKADGETQTPIESLKGRSEALSRACLLAGTEHHVFVWKPPDGYRRFDCPDRTADSPI
jgi:hypothetical protein